MEWIAHAGVVLIAVLMQAWALRALAPRIPQGDECDYLARSQWPDPHRPGLFLRVPGMPAAFRLVGRFSSRPEPALRIAAAASGVLAVIFVLLAGDRIGATPVAIVAAAGMLLLFERVLLSTHLWPDAPLCALHAMGLWLLVGPADPAQAISLGAVAALASMIRIEQIAFGIGLALVLIWRTPSAAVDISFWVLGPTLLALALWTWVAWRRYRIAWPDTTWLFNLRVLERQLDEVRSGPISVQGSITGLLEAERNAAPAASSHLANVARRPLALLISVLRRLAASFGPDTFVSGRLLPPLGQAYPALDPQWVERMRPWLRWSFPLISATAAWAMLARGAAPDYLLAALPLLGALVLVHFRSRYRLVLMPWICVSGAEALMHLDYRRLDALDAGVGALLLLLTWLNVRRPSVVEDPRQA